MKSYTSRHRPYGSRPVHNRSAQAPTNDTTMGDAPTNDTPMEDAAISPPAYDPGSPPPYTGPTQAFARQWVYDEYMTPLYGITEIPTLILDDRTGRPFGMLPAAANGEVSAQDMDCDEEVGLERVAGATLLLVGDGAAGGLLASVGEVLGVISDAEMREMMDDEEGVMAGIVSGALEVDVAGVEFMEIEDDEVLPDEEEPPVEWQGLSYEKCRNLQEDRCWRS